MGFPSPAADFVAPRLSPEIICGIGMDSRILETSSALRLSSRAPDWYRIRFC